MAPKDRPLPDGLITLLHSVAAATPVPELVPLLRQWEDDYLARRRALADEDDETPVARQQRFWYVAITREPAPATVLSGLQLKALLRQSEERLGAAIRGLSLGQLPGLDRPAPAIALEQVDSLGESLSQQAPYGVILVTRDGQPVGVYARSERLYSGLPTTVGGSTMLFGAAPTMPTRTCPACQRGFGALEIGFGSTGNLQWVCPHCKAPYPDKLP
jgi:hypothetical protein